MIATGAHGARAEDGAEDPSWLRAPLTRGPVAAAFGVDARRTWWGIDGAVPLRLGIPRRPIAGTGMPNLGLGLSIDGQAGSDMKDIRYSARVDRSIGRAGTWLGLSTGGGNRVLDTRLQLGAGLWRSFASISLEGGLMSSFVGYQAREASHWGYAPDTLHWRDTTTYQNVDRSGLWHTAHGTVRWRRGSVELSAIGGVTVGQRIAPVRWAQASLDIHASRRLKVMAVYGQRPGTSMTFDRSARPQTMLGVQVAPWAPREPRRPFAAETPEVREWSIRSVGGRTVCAVRCTGATSVELNGDFTDWVPVALTAVGSNRWETALSIPPGLHQVQIRLDGGEWQVPPGLPSAQHEFAGAVGLLIME